MPGDMNERGGTFGGINAGAADAVVVLLAENSLVEHCRE